MRDLARRTAEGSRCQADPSARPEAWQEDARTSKEAGVGVEVRAVMGWGIDLLGPCWPL